MADAEKTLRELLDQVLDDRGYTPREIEVKAIETGGANYTSVLFAINVSSPDRDDLKLFAKVVCVGDPLRVIMHIDYLYATERLVYNQLVRIYQEIEEEQQVATEHRYVFPKFYGCNAEYGKEAVIMEDLVASGYETFDRFKSLDWDHASVCMENIAKFHALSFAFEKYRPETFKEMTSNMVFEVNSTIEPDENMIALRKSMLENAVSVVKEEYKERIRNFAQTHAFWEKYNKPIGKPVISHGDYRTSNILFRKQDGRLQAIVVDYQTTHAGCPANDLMYFIFLGTDEEFRREHYERLLDHYHSSLEQALKRLAVDPSVYTREKLDSDMKEMLPYAVLLGVSVLPVVTVESNAAPKIEGDADVNNFSIKPNELFAKRFSGIVNDCVRWGAI
ncbi:uncharacterized protein LOC112044813 [Bicyclus anynana]|uniref:Uncharacterized protein LOC112044813 n=1 Tax=Bicyclus anynana TaxID=110368 RepID=A0A6J1N123_BICAN|nr:uncharacterized protein LOC112044813 [Bicyclus anynana]XP_052743649.1 uncharacterized protein LOC112044813 [Bicyclus anynana]